jgi:hypothetical protein
MSAVDMCFQQLTVQLLMRLRIKDLDLDRIMLDLNLFDVPQLRALVSGT